MIPTTQEQVYQALIDQGGPSYEGTTFEQFRCLYRGPNGRKCAAGLFIPDGKYVNRFEGQKADADDIVLTMKPLTADLDPKLIRVMQKAHDHAAQNLLFPDSANLNRDDTPNTWEEALRSEWLKRGLRLPS